MSKMFSVVTLDASHSLMTEHTEPQVCLESPGAAFYSGRFDRGSETAIPASCFSGTLYPADRSHGRDKPSSRCQVHKPGDCQT